MSRVHGTNSGRADNSVYHDAESYAQFFRLNPDRQGRVIWLSEDRQQKRAITLDGEGVTLELINEHLLGYWKNGVKRYMRFYALGWLSGDENGTNEGMIDLDAKNYPEPGSIEEARLKLRDVAEALGLHVYFEKSIRGNGWHVYVWSDELLSHAEMRAALKELAKRAELPGNTETYPAGGDHLSTWPIKPYAGALSCPKGLGLTYLEDSDGRAIPLDELDDSIEFSPASILRELAAAYIETEPSYEADPDDLTADALPLLKKAILSPPPSFERHLSLEAFLNIAARAGVLQEIAEFLKSSEVFHAWIKDGSRTLREWQAEIDRWATAKPNGKQVGIPFLEEQGFTIPKLPRAKLEKGEFIVIGELPKHPTELYVCTGRATGETIHQATGTPVICALRADNIRPAITALRKQLKKPSKCKMIIAADTVQAGLIAAHDAALYHHCKIVEPDFTGLDASSRPTTWHHLRTLAGLETVARQLQGATWGDPAKAFIKEVEKARRETHKLFSGHDKTVVNARYLSGIEIKPGATVICSGIGTGKTKSAEDEVKANPNASVLYISHRVKLATDAAERLGLDLYLDLGPDAGLASRSSFCLNSLPKLVRDSKGRPIKLRDFDYVIIDEIEQLLRCLPSKIKRKRQVLAILRRLIQRAKKLIVLDADISKLTMEILEEWRPNERFHCILNEYQVGTGREIMMYPSKGDVELSALEAPDIGLKAGGKVFFTTNEKRSAYQFNLLSYSPDKRGLLICGDNGKDEPVIDFCTDVNEQSKLYAFIVVTPSVNTGVSIDNDHFTWVGGYFGPATTTPSDALQALGRVRNTKRLHVYVDPRNRQYPTARDEIAATWEATHPWDAEHLGLNGEGLLGIADPDYEKICLNATLAANRTRSNFHYNFLKRAHLDGFTIIYADSAEGAKELELKGEELEEAAYVENRVRAPNIDEGTAEKLDNALALTYEEKCALEKHKLKKFFHMPEHIDKEDLRRLIIDDNRGKLRGQIITLEIANASPAKLQALVKEQHKKGELLIPDIRHMGAENAFYTRLLKAANVDPITLQLQSSEPYDAGSLKDFVAWAEEHRRQLQGARGIPRIPTLEMLEKEPLRFVSKGLRQLGLRQERVGKNAAGRYRIKAESLERMHSYMLTCHRLDTAWGQGAQGDTSKGDSSGNTYKNTGSVPPGVAGGHPAEDLYTRLRCRLESGEGPTRGADTLLEYFQLADAGDEEARAEIDAYLTLPKVVEALTGMGGAA